MDGGTLLLSSILTLSGVYRVNGSGTIQVDVGSGGANVTGTTTRFDALTIDCASMMVLPLQQGTKWTFLTSTQPIAYFTVLRDGWQID